jgi:hypothetical protein
MSEPVLERSVLERKERDELQTIARALGAQPPSRMKKADLVDLVLRTAGILGEPSTDDGSPGAEGAVAAATGDVGGETNGASRPADDRGAADGDHVTVEGDRQRRARDTGNGTAGAGGRPGAARVDVVGGDDDAGEDRAPAAGRGGGGGREGDLGGALAGEARGDTRPGGDDDGGDDAGGDARRSAGGDVVADGAEDLVAGGAEDLVAGGAEDLVAGRDAPRGTAGGEAAEEDAADGGTALGADVAPGDGAAGRPAGGAGAGRADGDARSTGRRDVSDGGGRAGGTATADPGAGQRGSRSPQPSAAADRLGGPRPVAGDEVTGDRDVARAGQERATGERPRGGRDVRPVGDRAERDRPVADRAPADRQPGERSAVDRDRARPERPAEDRGPAARSDREQGDRGNGANGRQQQPGQGNAAPPAPVNGQAEEGEGGNRRRRRRNRDRVEGQADRPEGSVEESFSGEPVPCAGLLDLREEGYGFLRVKGYLPHRDDVYVSVRQVRQLGLRKGDHLAGASRPANRQEKNPALLRIDQVNGQDPETARRRPRFEDLTPLFPDEKLRLEMPTDPTNMTARIVDLVAPIGKGQRGLIVSPPKAGKTTILKQIVRSIERNDPDVHLMVLLVDERPEEVTDMRRSTSGEVIASTFDRPSDEHTSVSELVIERAKRLVEEGRTSSSCSTASPAWPAPTTWPRPPPVASCRAASTRAPLPAEEVLRRRPQHRGGRLAHHPRHGAHRDRLEDGRGHLRGVQGHGEHGAAARPPPRRAPDLPGHRRRRQLHPPRGAPVQPPAAPAGVARAPGAARPLVRRRLAGGGPRAAHGRHEDVQDERRVPRRGSQGEGPAA